MSWSCQLLRIAVQHGIDETEACVSRLLALERLDEHKREALMAKEASQRVMKAKMDYTAAPKEFAKGDWC